MSDRRGAPDGDASGGPPQTPFSTRRNAPPTSGEQGFLARGTAFPEAAEGELSIEPDHW
ncbi:hypothetical protein [Streptomyces sp. NPDC006925]|uniref:hypothetical protein n=1 Tax=Streptomyces sp. NPDC006925 TaxID=3364768 RepID=UPI0036A8B493